MAKFKGHSISIEVSNYRKHFIKNILLFLKSYNMITGSQTLTRNSKSEKIDISVSKMEVL